MRLLTGYITGSGKECTLIGDESLSKRPMDRIAEPLKDWGADIELRNKKFSPIKIKSSNICISLLFLMSHNCHTNVIYLFQ